MTGKSSVVSRALRHAQDDLCEAGNEQLHISGGETDLDLAIAWALRFTRYALQLAGQPAQDDEARYAKHLMGHALKAYRTADAEARVAASARMVGNDGNEP